ncbi:EAL domain-containing protein [Halalkalibacter kiskunsagensis]|uniref:EAL domain-containing protein n=1 Tax=Halalkalibacter kiskunsagensis TaxID=1548599 RepID=A0ABV6K7U0_9BACI
MNQSEWDKLEESEMKYQAVFTYNANAIFILDQFGKITEVNPATLTITGFSSHFLLNKKITEIVHQNSIKSVQAGMTKVWNGHSVTIDIELNHHHLKEVIVHVTMVPLKIGEIVNGAIIFAQNITEDFKTKRIALEDELTGLPNRRYLIETLESAITEAKRANEKLAVMLIDLDRFKLVNDAIGSLFGDRALRLIAERLKSSLNEQEVVTRVGGDEFVILIPQLKSEMEAKSKASRLLERLKKPLIIEEYEFTLTGSIGISIFPNNGEDCETIIKSADAAIYRAKSNGSDSFELYKREMRFQLNEKFQIENDLRKALERGEFSLYFQPQFDARSQRYCGEEVLVRWNHPDEGLISPGKFISIAEETGLINTIGEWVLREACFQKKKWIDNGFPAVPVSVNLSTKQFLKRSIVEIVSDILQASELPPHLLELEVTESITIDIQRTSDSLKRLQSLGVQISLDDFGTGYSSLQYVSQLPIQELKIDQSFVRNIGNGKHNEGIISMIINLAHFLKISVIAEGVETKEQLDYLVGLKCDKVQGYYFSKPLSVVDFERLINNW